MKDQFKYNWINFPQHKGTKMKISILANIEPDTGETIELHHYKGVEPNASNDPDNIYQLNYNVSSITIDFEKGDVLEAASIESAEIDAEFEKFKNADTTIVINSELTDAENDLHANSIGGVDIKRDNDGNETVDDETNKTDTSSTV